MRRGMQAAREALREGARIVEGAQQRFVTRGERTGGAEDLWLLMHAPFAVLAEDGRVTIAVGACGVETGWTWRCTVFAEDEGAEMCANRALSLSKGGGTLTALRRAQGSMRCVETPKAYAPAFGRFGEKMHEFARAFAWLAQEWAGVGSSEGLRFDQQQAAHHRFAATQPRRHQLMRFECERVFGRDIARVAEQHAQCAHEQGRDAPQRQWRCDPGRVGGG